MSEQQRESGAQVSTQQYPDEIDLVDIIVFMWRIRYFIILGVVVGLGGGALLYKRSSAAVSGALVTGKQAAGYYEFHVRENLAEELTSLPVAERIKTLGQQLSLEKNGQVIAANLQKTGVLGANNSGEKLAEALTQVKVTESVKNPGTLLVSGVVPNKERFERSFAEALTNGINLVVTAYNENEQQSANIENKLGERKRTQIEDFGSLVKIVEQLIQVNGVEKQQLLLSSHSGGAVGLEGEFDHVVGIAVKLLVMAESNRKLTSDEVVVKQKEISDLAQRYVVIDIKRRALQSYLEKGRALLLPVEMVEDFHQSNVPAVSSDLSASTGVSCKKYLAIGFILGGFLGFVLGGMWMFFKANWARIRSSLRG